MVDCIQQMELDVIKCEGLEAGEQAKCELEVAGDFARCFLTCVPDLN